VADIGGLEKLVHVIREMHGVHQAEYRLLDDDCIAVVTVVLVTYEDHLWSQVLKLLDAWAREHIDELSLESEVYTLASVGHLSRAMHLV